jgi:NAD(P)-dependent dehydrogenase (short-subunit alcohol dehydrogenase family)
MNKKILITGCSSGFGFDAAKQLAKSGHHVYATMRASDGRNAAAKQALCDYAEAEGASISVHEMDVTCDDSVQGAIAELDGVDVLINNAGCGYGGAMETFTGAELLAQLDLNIVGAMRAANAVLPIMRAQGDGLIIQVSSVAGRGAMPGFGAYHASKWGLEGMSQAMRYELAPLGVDVVLVEPGPFETKFFDNMTHVDDPDVKAAYAHVNTFFSEFTESLMQMFSDDAAPTDAKLVIDIFEDLINQPKGQRPLRTVAGIDFGMRAMNDATEPLRKAGLEEMNIGDWDGPRG